MIVKWYDITIVLDMSGSMGDNKFDDCVITNYNEMLKKFQNMKGADKNDEKILLTVIVFNSTTKPIIDHEFVQNVKPLDKTVYKAGGGTALNDAIGEAITCSEKRFQTLEMLPPFKSSFFILTDGGENSSKIFNNKQGDL